MLKGRLALGTALGRHCCSSCVMGQAPWQMALLQVMGPVASKQPGYKGPLVAPQVWEPETWELLSLSQARMQQEGQGSLGPPQAWRGLLEGSKARRKQTEQRLLTAPCHQATLWT